MSRFATTAPQQLYHAQLTGWAVDLRLWLALLGGVPLLVAAPVPLQDWPNHVAGARVLIGLLDGDPFWLRFYRFGTFLVPNAAVDLALLGLHRLGVGEPPASNLLLCGVYAAFVGGMAWLSRVLARLDAVRVAGAVLLFYGIALFWGLVNYVLGVGLLWCVLAWWLRARRGRLAIAGVGAAGLVFVHAVPALLLGVLLLGFDVARLRRGAAWRGALSGGVALGVAVAVLRALPGETGRDLGLVYAGGPSWAGFTGWKLRVLATALLGGSALQDAASVAALLGGAAALAAAARVRLPDGVALGGSALLLLVLLAPERLGTGSLLDVRLAPLPLCLLLAGARLEWRGGRARRACVAVVAGLVLLRTAAIAVEWRRAGAVFAAHAAAAARLPAGSLMMMAYGRPLASLGWTEIWSPPIQSVAAPVVARPVFFPALFANPDQQPIVLRPEFAWLTQPWDLTDAAHSAASLRRIAPLCGAYPGVYLTVLYGGAPFRILDACAAQAAASSGVRALSGGGAAADSAL